jgi:hypothetical protein
MTNAKCSILNAQWIQLPPHLPGPQIGRSRQDHRRAPVLEMKLIAQDPMCLRANLGFGQNSEAGSRDESAGVKAGYSRKESYESVESF